MSTRVDLDRVYKQGSVRWYYQVKGPAPGNPIAYGGVDGVHLKIESISNPIGSINPINVPDPKTAGRYIRIGRSRDAPDYPTASLSILQDRGYFPQQYGTFQRMPVSFYGLVGETKDLSDFVGGWDGYVKILEYGEATEGEEPGSAWDSDDMLEDSMEFTLEAAYNIGQIVMGEEGAATVDADIRDAVWGITEYGTEMVYFLVDGTTLGTPQAPSVVYLKKSGLSWTATEVAITGSDTSDVPSAIALVGDKLIVAYDDGSTGGYFYAQVNSVTGVPGSFTQVAGGFVTSKAPLDIAAKIGREVYFCGEGGYIYKTQTVGSSVSVLDAGVATTNNLARIDHDDMGNVVAVGASNTVVYSTDRGKSWQTAAGSPSGGGNLQAVAVVDQYIWWVGDDAGAVYYTEDGGATWTAFSLTGSPAAINDIVFPTRSVGYILANTSAPAALLYSTWNGGVDWATSDPRLPQTLPTADKFNRLAVPQVTNPNVLANWFAIAGLAGDGSDGIALIGEPKMK